MHLATPAGGFRTPSDRNIDTEGRLLDPTRESLTPPVVEYQQSSVSRPPSDPSPMRPSARVPLPVLADPDQQSRPRVLSAVDAPGRSWMQKREGRVAAVLRSASGQLHPRSPGTKQELGGAAAGGLL